MAVRTVLVRLQAEASRYRSEMMAAAGSTKMLMAEMDKANKAGHLDKVADQAGRMGLALVAGFGMAVAAAARFEKAMSNVNAATHASAADMKSLSAAALQAGKDTKFSATEAAQGITELAKAGVTTANVLNGGLKGALALAAAGELDVAEAAETAASAMTQFKLTGDQIPHVADLLSAAAGKAQGSVRDMSQALNQSGLVAAQMGLSIEETVGTLASFASAGLMGSDAGTSFKTMLLRLAAPTDIARKRMDELGISAFDAQGQFIGMAKFAGVLEKGLSGLSQEERLAAQNVIFGTDAIRASSITYEQGAEGIATWIDKTNESGYAADTARRKTDNLIGDVERLTGELETLAITSGSGANTGLRLLVKTADELVSAFASAPNAVSGTIVVVAGLAGAALLTFAAFMKASAAMAAANAQLTAMGPLGARTAGVLGTVGRAAGRTAGAFLALQAAGALIRAMQADVNMESPEFTKSLVEWGKSGQLAGDSLRVLGVELENLENLKILADQNNDRRAWSRGLQDFFEGFVPGLDTANGSMTKTRELMAGLDKQMTDLIGAGKQADAKAVFDQLTKSLDGTGVSTQELMALLPGYAEALKNVGTSTAKMDTEQRKAERGAMLLAGGLGEAAYEGKTLIQVYDSLNGQAISFAEAQINAEEALDNVTESFREHGKSLKLDDEAGRANVTTVIAMSKAAAEAAQQKFIETGSLAAASQEYNNYISRLRTALHDAGLQEAQINELIAAYAKMPKIVTTTVNANTGAANAAIDEVVRRVAGLQDKSIRLSATVYWTSDGNLHMPGGTQQRRWGGVTEHARNGLLREAQTFSAVNSGARYAFAEPATKGEAFIPKSGNAGRSLGILQQAAGWYGHKVMPAGGSVGGTGGGGTSTQVIVHEHVHRLELDGTGMLQGYRRTIELRGGNAQNVTGSRREG